MPVRSWWHGVKTDSSPWMASRQAAYSQAKPAAGTMCANGFFHVGGTRGGETAAALHSEHNFQGRKNDAIGADK